MTATIRRQVGVGLQGSVGSSVVIDTNLRATCSLNIVSTKHQPDEYIGQHGPGRHIRTESHGEGSLVMDAVYEQILYPITMAMGIVSPTGGADPYTWTFLLPFRISPITLISPFTLEYIDSGPSNGGGDGGGTHVVRMVDTFATALTISATAPDSWQVEAALSGRAVDLPDSLSGNPEPDHAIVPIKMGQTTLHVDDLYANIGDTLVEEFISFNWKLEGNYHSKQWAGSMNPNGWGAGGWKTTLELILEASAVEAQAFEDAILTEAMFAVRVKGYVDANDNCNIDGMYYVASVDPLDDRGGNNTLKITLLGAKDTLSANAGGITVVTRIGAL